MSNFYFLVSVSFLLKRWIYYSSLKGAFLTTCWFSPWKFSSEISKFFWTVITKNVQKRCFYMVSFIILVNLLSYNVRVPKKFSPVNSPGHIPPLVKSSRKTALDEAPRLLDPPPQICEVLTLWSAIFLIGLQVTFLQNLYIFGFWIPRESH